MRVETKNADYRAQDPLRSCCSNMLAVHPIKAYMSGIWCPIIMAKDRGRAACYYLQIIIPETSSPHL